MYTKKILYTTVLMISFLAGCTQENKPLSKPKMDVEVGVYLLKSEPITLKQELTGRTKANLSAEIRPQVSGIIQARLFQEGSYVKKGTVLYQIDPSVYEAAYAEAHAALENAQVSVETARLKSERYKELLQAKGVSTQDAEDAKVVYLQAKATAEGKKAALESARINLDYTKIKAPINGYIGTSSVTTGALVNANQTTALATIRTLDPIYVDMSQSSAQLLKLRTLLNKEGLSKGSMHVNLKLEDGSLYQNEGTLEFKEVAVDENTGSVILRAIFSNPDGVLLPGMFVRAIVDEAINHNALLVPQQAIMRDAKGNASAYVVNENSTIETRSLDIDRALKDRWLVSKGLNAGDRVVVEGINKIRQGDTVKVTDVSDSIGSIK